MTSFASLMALSATNTRQSQQAVESALQERKRKEALQRKQQEERDAKEREQAKKLRLKAFEEEKRQKERLERLEAERKAKDTARERREEEQRNTLLYGPKKAAKLSAAGSPQHPSSASGVRDAVRKHRMPEEDLEDAPGQVLTREEMRQRKREAELRRQFGGPKRSGHNGGSYHRMKATMPGGAVNIVVNANGQQTTAAAYVTDSASGKSLKERLTQGPNTLTLLRTQTRDRRTVDEAQQDIRIKLGKASTKMLSGEDARAFDDWFGGSSKEKKAAPASPGPASGSPTPVPTASSSSSRPGTSTSSALSSSTSMNQKKGHSIQRPPKPYPTTSTARSSTVVSRASSTEKHTSSSQSKQPKANKLSASTSASSRHAPTVASHRESYRENHSRSKRPRSPSLSDSPPPPKRRQREEDYYEDEDEDALDVGGAIWAMFGKKRDQYVSQDVFSDDEDMEADASALEREEHISARIAKREEQQALEDERRHEEEKRRRKKERERALERGY